MPQPASKRLLTELNGSKKFGRSLLFTDPAVGGIGDGTTDNTTAFNTAIGLLAAGGGELVFPAGVYLFNGATTTVPGGIWLRGTGYDYHTPTGSTDRPNKGAVLRATATMTRLVQFGSDGTSSASGQTGASASGLVFDGNGFAASTVILGGRRNRLRECEVYGGTAQTLKMAGQNGHVSHCVISAEAVGDVVLVQGYFDNKLWQNQLREPSTTGAIVRIIDASNTDIQMNHMWAGANGSNAAAEALIVVANSGASGYTYDTLITDNTIESVIGPHIKISCTGGSGATLRNVNITGNRFYQQSPFTDLSAPVVQITGNGNVSGVVFSSNTARNLDNTHRYKSFIDLDTTLFSFTRGVMVGNTGMYVNALVTGAPAGGGTSVLPKMAANAIHNGSNSVFSEFNGQATFTGDGTKTQFKITHNLGISPNYASIDPASAAAAAAGAYISGVDSTFITITCPTPPTNGASLVWYWRCTA